MEKICAPEKQHSDMSYGAVEFNVSESTLYIT